MKHKWTDSPLYIKWVKERDKAVEVIYDNARRKSADVMRKALTTCLWQAKLFYTDMQSQSHINPADQFEQEIKKTFAHAKSELIMIMNEMRIFAYMLSKASEAEIIARSFPNDQVKAKVDVQDLSKQLDRPKINGASQEKRIGVYLDNLARKIVSSAQTASLNPKSAEDFLRQVAYSFPRLKKLPRRKTLPKPLQEADQSPKITDKAQDFVDEKTWNQMLDDYKSKYVPKFRGPEAVLNEPSPDEDTYYAWQYERDIMNDFVQAVRDGQVDAAKDNGITDFVWVAIVDDKTDECCLWRDGLLTSEIAKLLPQHQNEDEGCNIDGSGLVPPIHFNCRCTLAPATDAIPEKTSPDYASFNDWLES